MNEENEIYIKLELNKDKDDNLSIMTYFNPNSPNFYKEGDFYIWKPTFKEKGLIIEAFNLLIQKYTFKNNDKKIFKFSDKISELNNNPKELKKTNKGSYSDKIDSNDNIDNKKDNYRDNEIKINEVVEKNKIKERKYIEDERDRKIEKILRENKKID